MTQTQRVNVRHTSMLLHRQTHLEHQIVSSAIARGRFKQFERQVLILGSKLIIHILLVVIQRPITISKTVLTKSVSTAQTVDSVSISIESVSVSICSVDSVVVDSVLNSIIDVVRVEKRRLVFRGHHVEICERGGNITEWSKGKKKVNIWIKFDEKEVFFFQEIF